MLIFQGVPSLKLTFSHLNMDGWNTSFRVSFWDDLFAGAMLVSGRVNKRLRKLDLISKEDPVVYCHLGYIQRNITLPNKG